MHGPLILAVYRLWTIMVLANMALPLPPVAIFLDKYIMIYTIVIILYVVVGPKAASWQPYMQW